MKIAIASGKGGTGKTTLAINLASFLADSQHVVLVDMDVEEPNAGIFLNIPKTNEIVQKKMIPVWDQSKCTLCNKCQKICRFNAVIQINTEVLILPELCHSCYACSELCPVHALPMEGVRMGETKVYANGKMHFIESKLDIGQEQAVPLIKSTFSYLQNNFTSENNIIIDAPPGTSCPLIETVIPADIVFLVTEPTPFGFHDLQLSIDVMNALNKPFYVIINRHGIGNAEVETYCRRENIEILGKIPFDKKIAGLYGNGKLIYPEHQAFREVLENISNRFFTTL